jgi:hypothetical protein
MKGNPNYLKIKNLQFRRECRTFLPFVSHARIVVATVKRRPLVPDIVIETVDASDGIKHTALQAAQRYRHTARTTIRKAANEMKKSPYCSIGHGP